MSFTTALITYGIVLTLGFYLLLWLSNRRLTLNILDNPWAYRFSSVVYKLLLLLFIVANVLSYFLDYRPVFYFVVVLLVFCYLALGKISSDKKIFLVVLVIGSLPLTIYSNNHFYHFGSDQGRDIHGCSLIVKTGEFMPTNKTTYYDSFPFHRILMASTSIVTGLDRLYYVIDITVVHLLFTLILFLVSKKITSSMRARVAFLVPFMWMSSPALSFVQASNRVLSIVFAFTALYLANISKPNRIRNAILLFIPITVAMVASHASGPIFMLSLLLPLLFSSVLSSDRLRTSNNLSLICSLTIVVALIYWVFNELVFRTIMGTSHDLIRTITNFFNPENQLQIRYAARPYLASEASTNPAFSWAVPPALIASYFLHKLQNGLIKRSQDKGKNDLVERIGGYGSLIGLVFLVTSFLVANYGTHIDLIAPTFAILLFLMILALPKLVSSRNELVVIATVCILGTSLLFGVSSPDWAPIENPDFEQRRGLYKSFVSTRHLGYFLPENVTLYLTLDYDVYISTGEHVHTERPGSYRVERRKIQAIEAGRPISEIADNNSTIFIIRAKRLALHSTDLFNLVVSIPKHAMVLPLCFDCQTNSQES